MNRKTLITILVGALVASAFMVGPADAKKKKKKKPKPAVCSEYVPGDMGAEAESFKITDEATEEAPLEIPVTLEMSAANFVPVEDPTEYAVNLQVDSAATEVGLYVLFEFDQRRDYDIYLYYPTGEEAASSHAFNTLVETENGPADISGEAGNGEESTASSEKILGVKTADCQGWTLNTVNWFGEGGDMTVKAWLGEPQTDPVPPGA